MKVEVDQVMTVDDLAAYLRCHKSTIYRLLKNGTIPAFRLGSDWRFHLDEIEKWAHGPRLKRTHP